MARKSIDSIYSSLGNIEKRLNDVVATASTLSQDVAAYGGEIQRVVCDQLESYLIPSIKKFIGDEQTPGSIIGIVKFMDSVPLAMTREVIAPEPTVVENPETAEAVANSVEIAMPSGSETGAMALGDEPSDVVTDADSIAPGTSFNNPTGLQNESVKRHRESEEKSYDVYYVVRKKTTSSTMGDLDCLKDQVVNQFKSREEAEENCKALNACIGPEEKELLGTEFDVVEKKVEIGNV